MQVSRLPKAGEHGNAVKGEAWEQGIGRARKQRSSNYLLVLETGPCKQTTQVLVGFSESS